MAETKNYLSYEGLQLYDESIKKYIATEFQETIDQMLAIQLETIIGEPTDEND